MPGLTTDNDIGLVRRMVKTFMRDERTMSVSPSTGSVCTDFLSSILAIIPSNVDPATQEILKLAKEVDPEMRRTMAVLTKPDLNIERTTQQIAIEHVMGQRSNLTLGYYVVKNRGPDEMDKTLEEGQQDEREFFAMEPWSVLRSTGRAGIDSLKPRVRELLAELIKREFPKLRQEVQEVLNDLGRQRANLGEARGTPALQSEYLCGIADNFQTIARDARNAHYATQELLLGQHSLRLITRVVEANELFSKQMVQAGQTRGFGGNTTHAPIFRPKNWNDQVPAGLYDISMPSSPLTDDSTAAPDEVEELLTTCKDLVPEKRIAKHYPELNKYLDAVWSLETPSTTSDEIMDYIRSVYNASRGRDLGNVCSPQCP